MGEASEDDCNVEFYEEIVSLYNKILPELATCKGASDNIKAQLRGRIKDDKKRKKIVWWEQYFRDIRKYPVLLGKASIDWRPNLLWLLGKNNMEKVLSEYYQRGSMSVPTKEAVRKEQDEIAMFGGDARAWDKWVKAGRPERR